ncbi:YihY/virulence factor BrkB family protein [Pseudactinotalea suaedae]|uniref:YihY/virulence factor BrkB family protein n=1 Tax=Pseudactinotalea suaedae TaxID=1524924 RepID=UPI001391C5AD|nr:YihY/virulence factor BrkB family protein [Pseudactinotalea suaedae]
MLVTAVLVALAGAVAARRVPWVRRRMPPPASTALMALAATAAVVALADTTPGVARAAIAAGVTLVLGAAAILLTGWILGRLAARVGSSEALSRLASMRERVIAGADAVPWRVGRWNVVAVVARSVARASDVRVTGLAAEMSYYALISLVPISTALGSSLGFLRRLLGDEQVEEIRTSIVDGLTTIFAEQVAGDILAPLVDGLLDEGRASVAIGALLITLYLASRVFRAAVRALDDAYRVTARRNVVAQFLLGLVFTVAALVTLLTIALLVVVGPLLGGGDVLAEALGLGEVFRVSWEVLRWPVALGLGMLFLTFLYRYAPNANHHWLTCLPGAVVGSAGLLAVSAGFAVYVRAFAPNPLSADAANAVVVQAAAQMLSLVLAGVLWLWLASIAVLLGGIVNAELDAEREDSPDGAAKLTAAG